jgi:hypothetical protein
MPGVITSAKVLEAVVPEVEESLRSTIPSARKLRVVA